MSCSGIDVLSDAGFLVMDLRAHGRHDLAFGFLDAYLTHTGEYAGLRGWRQLPWPPCCLQVMRHRSFRFHELLREQAGVWGERGKIARAKMKLP